mgnify:CR=1 FL=1|jgi:uncharacterized protein (DUF983 family)
MSTRPSGIVSLISGKCPRCRTGKAFKYPFYNVFKASEVHERCSCCDVKFEPEPGFFWGAMYFSYALNVGTAIIVGILLFFFFGDPELWVYIAVIVPSILILTPIYVRFSRLLMMYIASPYRKFNPALGKK